MRYSVGYRIAEYEPAGNNPTTISPLLKDEASYQKYIRSRPFNGLSGNTGPTLFHSFYLNTEWQKTGASAGFWKKYTVTAGLMATAKITKSIGSLDYRTDFNFPDTGYRELRYALTRKLQFVGLNAGLNRRFNISGTLGFTVGLQAQIAIAAIHRYKQQLDTTFFIFGGERRITTSSMPDLKGKNYLQWQLIVPVAIEYAFDKSQFLLRVEINTGVTGGPFTPNAINRRIFVGAGAWLCWQPVRKRR